MMVVAVMKVVSMICVVTRDAEMMANRHGVYVMNSRKQHRHVQFLGIER